MSNAISPSVTFPSPNEWPNTIRDITGLSNDRQVIVISIGHGFTTQDIGITSVGFTNVSGMIQINGLDGIIQSVIDSSRFTVNIDTSQFFTYTSGGYVTIITGIPPIETQGFQTFNTPFQNIA